jgi:hypothetical protein
MSKFKSVKIGESTHLEFIEFFLGKEILDLYLERYDPSFTRSFEPTSIVRYEHNLADSINEAFSWGYTKEGHDFWSKQHRIISSDLNFLIKNNVL